uniref:Uncharacterized protein n=1 Tax=Setaria viridis TaxID=4556 RepID=A0A4V6D6C7_SETVI|nr:hypothetical protein SEVIR_5G127200v2 [Setaria viridis]
MSCMYQSNIVSYARTKLLSMWPNVEALTIHSPGMPITVCISQTLNPLLVRLKTHQWCQANSSISSTCMFVSSRLGWPFPRPMITFLWFLSLTLLLYRRPSVSFFRDRALARILLRGKEEGKTVLHSVI